MLGSLLFPLKFLTPWFRQVQSKILEWSARRPILSVCLVIMVSIIVLPAVMVGALTPIALLFTYSDLLSTQGGVYILYNILFQGFLLAVLLVTLFLVLFGIATFASVLHSYKYFNVKQTNMIKNKNMQ